MNDFYITFGQLHRTVDGKHLKDYWVRITASDERTAREVFRNKFGAEYLENPNQFATSYPEEQFKDKKHFFPKGELMHIEEENVHTK